MSVGSSLKMLSRLSNVADDVVESGAKSVTKGGVIRNVTSSLSSNQTKGNVKMMKNAGADMVNAVKNEPKNVANNVINSKTANKALDNFNAGGTGLNAADNVIHPEVAATYNRGGGSRGRGGNRGYNNRNNYGGNRGGNGNVNFKNKNQQSQYFNNNKNKNTSKYFNNSGPSAEAEVTMGMETPDIDRGTVEKAINNMEGSQYYNRQVNNIDSTPKNTTYSYKDNSEPRTRRRGNRQQTSQTNQAVEPEFNFDTNSKINPEVEPQFNTGGGDSGPNTGGNSGPNTNTGGDSGPNKAQETFNKAKERMNRTFDKTFGSASETIKDTFAGGIKDSYNNIKNSDMGIFESIGKAHTNEDGSINWRRAAGTFMTASAAARIASGGGVYKDRYGNPNLIGVPFI